MSSAESAMYYYNCIDYNGDTVVWQFKIAALIFLRKTMQFGPFHGNFVIIRVVDCAEAIFGLRSRTLAMTCFSTLSG